MNIPTIFAAEKKQWWRDANGKTHNYASLATLAQREVCLKWRPVGWKIQFYPGKIGYLGMANGDEKKIYIWIRKEFSPKQVAGTIVHELAHAYDFLFMTTQLRTEWLKVRGLPTDTPWLPCGGCTDNKSGAGDFAESVSWTFQGKEGGFKSRLGLPPNAKQQAFIRKLLK